MSDEPDDNLACGVCEDENPHFAAGDRWIINAVR